MPSGVEMHRCQKEHVCWTSIARARKQASFAQRKFITKWISGDTPSGALVARFALLLRKPWSVSLPAKLQTAKDTRLFNRRPPIMV